jgi:hypothetical protein
VVRTYAKALLTGLLCIQASYFVVDPIGDQLAGLARLIDGRQLRPAVDWYSGLAEARTCSSAARPEGSVGRSFSVSSAARQERKGKAFRALHARDIFVMPNPWDVGSARILEVLGFPALATTSSGFAFTLGRPDGAVTLDEMAAHSAALDRATDLPISADLENGYGPDPEDAAQAVTRAAEIGGGGRLHRGLGPRRPPVPGRPGRRADRRFRGCGPKRWFPV